MGGWDQMRARLKGDNDEGRPMLYAFSTCRDFIRTLPALQHDKVRAEDVDTEGEDHAPDEARYACMSRPYGNEPERPSDIIAELIRPKTLDEMIAMCLAEEAERDDDQEAA